MNGKFQEIHYHFEFLYNEMNTTYLIAGTCQDDFKRALHSVDLATAKMRVG